MFRGCLEHDLHTKFPIEDQQLTLEGDFATGKDEIEFYKASCGRLSCPTCYEKVCGKLALKIEHRMNAFKLKGRELKAVHVVVSPSEIDIDMLKFPSLRKKAYHMSMKCGILGGSIIFHPFRRYSEDDFKEDLERGFDYQVAPAAWYLSPHFHIIGYGWIQHTKENFERSGWIVKNLGVRKSIRATAHYQLSHCGISPRFHSVVWFGALSYGKLKCGKLPPEEHVCSLCGSPYEKVEFVHEEDALIVKSSLKKEGIFYVDHGIFRKIGGAEEPWRVPGG